MPDLERRRGLHPTAWLVWTGAAATAALLTRNPWYLLALAAVAVAVVWRATHQPPGRGTLFLAGAVVLTSTVVNLLFSRAGDTVLLELPVPWIGGPYTLEALLFGVSAGVQVSTLLLVMAVLTRTLTAADLLRRTPRSLYAVGVASTLGLSFAPHARQAYLDLREARELRGLSTATWREAPAMLTPLVVAALERATAQAEALTARGWAAAGSTGGRWGLTLAWIALGAAMLLCAAAPERALLATALLAAAVVAQVLILRRRAQPAAYRHEPWRPKDVAVCALAVSAAAAFLVRAVQRPGSLGFYPYPLATWAALDVLPLMAVGALAAPAGWADT